MHKNIGAMFNNNQEYLLKIKLNYKIKDRDLDPPIYQKYTYVFFSSI